MKMTSKSFSLSEIEKARRTTAALEGGRRVRRYIFTGEALLGLLTHGQQFRIANGIPDGAAFKGITIDHNTNAVAIWAEHESFHVVPTGANVMIGPEIEIERI